MTRKLLVVSLASDRRLYIILSVPRIREHSNVKRISARLSNSRRTHSSRHAFAAAEIEIIGKGVRALLTIVYRATDAHIMKRARLSRIACTYVTRRGAEQLFATWNRPRGKMRRRAKARHISAHWHESLTTGEKTRKPMERRKKGKPARSARSRAHHALVCSLTVHVDVTRIRDGNKTIQIALQFAARHGEQIQVSVSSGPNIQKKKRALNTNIIRYNRDTC